MLRRELMYAILAIGMLAVFFTPSQHVVADDKENNWCGEVGTNHGDNNPSEKKFFQKLKTENICDFSDDIDAMILKGAIEEDSKCDFDCFKQTTVFKQKPAELSEDGFENIKICMLERYQEFPKSNGDFHLAEYEIKDCAQGNY